MFSTLNVSYTIQVAWKSQLTIMKADMKITTFMLSSFRCLDPALGFWVTVTADWILFLNSQTYICLPFWDPTSWPITSPTHSVQLGNYLQFPHRTATIQTVHHRPVSPLPIPVLPKGKHKGLLSPSSLATLSH